MSNSSAPASAAQISYIRDLLKHRVWSDKRAINAKYIYRTAVLRLVLDWAVDPDNGIEIVKTVTDGISHPGDRANAILEHLAKSSDPDKEYCHRPLTMDGAGELIVWLKTLPFSTGVAIPLSESNAMPVPTHPSSNVLEDGMYLADGKIYKVQHAVHGSGRQYAKIAIVEANADGSYNVSFRYVAGAIAKLSPQHKMSYEQAKEFGALYGTCCRCGRTLTDELSIALGIGPICGEREFGGEFKIRVKEAKLQLK